MNTRNDVDSLPSTDPTAWIEPDLPREATDDRPTGAVSTAGDADVDRAREEIVHPADRPAASADNDWPLPAYRLLTVPEILRQTAGLSIDQLRAIKEYEKSHRRRKTLLTKLERMLRAASGNGSQSV